MRTIPPPSDVFFRGRTGDPRLGEWIALDPELKNPGGAKFGILGCPDDTGVRLNRGRPGADKGPDLIRKAFYKMALPQDWEKKKLIDVGNIPVSTDIVATHESAKDAAQRIVGEGLGLIALGGGHDFAFPCFSGFAAATREQKPRARLGLINVDPHLDVRELINDKAHSGTPFRQLIKGDVLPGANLVEFGARPNRNAAGHFRFCADEDVRIVELDAIFLKGPLKSFQRELNLLSQRCDVLGVTIDMDSCSEAEGMSAAPVIGFSARELLQLAVLAGQNPKVRYLEIAEVAPALDANDRSARIAAELVFGFLNARLSLTERPSRSPKNKQASARNAKKR